MHHSLPRQPEDHGFRHDSGLSDELRAVAAGARRRAALDGDRQIDTAHLLHSLLEHSPEVRAGFTDPGRLARLLGYLVQRSIGYGLRWQSSVEESGAPPRTPEPGWSPAAALAMENARARTGGRRPARGADLFAALAADPGCRAVEVLRRAGIAVTPPPRCDSPQPG